MSQNIPPYSLKPLVRPNKNFVYNGKKYPIDFRLIKNNSNYFFEKRDQYKEIHDIVLPQEPIDISEDSFRCFISSCHNDNFDINESNVFSLYQLSIRYEVPYLYSLADDYIKKHDKSLVFRSIQYKTMLQKETANGFDSSFGFESDEESIASNFFDYINDEQLLELPVPVLYRIINNRKMNFDELNQTNRNQLIEFLFKCLDKYKRQASVLFSNLDLENQRIEIFSRLTNEYSGVFDFNMINSKFLLKTTTDLLSEMSELKQNYSKCISEVKNLFDEVKNERQKQNDLLESFKILAQDQITQEKEKLTQTIESIKQQFSEEKRNLRDEISNKINEMKDSINQNNKQMSSFVTKDVLNLYSNLVLSNDVFI